MNPEDLPRPSLWIRLTRGGVTLSPLEAFLLGSLERFVPEELAEVLRQEWRGLNLVQRSPEWDELRFYCLVSGRLDRSQLPKLPVRDGEIKLLSLALRPGADPDPVHVNFWAVDGWFFNLNANRTLRPFRNCREMNIEGVEHSYRSSLLRLNSPGHG